MPLRELLSDLQAIAGQSFFCVKNLKCSHSEDMEGSQNLKGSHDEGHALLTPKD